MKIPEKSPSDKQLLLELVEKDINPIDLLAVHIQEQSYNSYADTKYKTIPEEIKNLGGDRNTWWFYLTLQRKSRAKYLDITANDNSKFSFSIDNADLAILHELDQQAGGSFEIDGKMPNKNVREKYLINSLIEESFSSSFIEGAISTREKAKKLISENREPKDKHEIMILNNFKTMQNIQEWINEDLTPELICKIHSCISQNTLSEDKLGKFRTEDDKNIVLSDNEGNIYHTPCNYLQIEEKIAQLCEFINKKSSGINFIPPIIKAIILHFSVAYIHPFSDGNGRTSRALFYWYLLKNNYWLVKYISISKIIIETGNRYYKSFLNTEIYNNDLNYFIKFQLEIFNRAIDAFHKYIEEKKRKLDDNLKHFSILNELNDRQKDIVLKIIRNPSEHFEFTIEKYSKINKTSWETARKDLEILLKKGILTKYKNSRIFIYIVSKDFIVSGN